MRHLYAVAIAALVAQAPAMAQQCPLVFVANARGASDPATTMDSAYTATVLRARSAVAARQWADAATLWRGALETNARVPAHWNEYGKALYQGGQYRESVAAFERAIQLGGTTAAIGAWNVARAYAQAGNDRQAYRWLSRAFDEGFRPRAQVQEEPAFQRYRGNERFRALSDSIDKRLPPRGERLVRLKEMLAALDS
jgi:Tfp pilus assembly protein PilF